MFRAGSEADRSGPYADVRLRQLLLALDAFSRDLEAVWDWERCGPVYGCGGRAFIPANDLGDVAEATELIARRFDRVTADAFRERLGWLSAKQSLLDRFALLHQGPGAPPIDGTAAANHYFGAMWTALAAGGLRSEIARLLGLLPGSAAPNGAAPTGTAIGGDDARKAGRGAADAIPSGEAAADAGGRKAKRSTVPGEAREKLIAALTKHHDYYNGGCGNTAPVGNNELARLARVAPSTASGFFEKEFGGHEKYQAACADRSRLVAVLKLLNQEFSPHLLIGSKLPGEGDREDE